MLECLMYLEYKIHVHMCTLYLVRMNTCACFSEYCIPNTLSTREYIYLSMNSVFVNLGFDVHETCKA